jgi:hypothetical protein
MSSTATLKWIGLALLGLAVAAAVAIAAGNLASQQIGLASEPISAGDALAPHRTAPRAPARARVHRPPRDRREPATGSAETVVPTSPPPEPSQGGTEGESGADD